MRRIIREFKIHSKGFTFRIGLLFLISLLSGGISLVTPKISGRLVDILVEVKLEREIYRYALIFLLISLLRMLLSFISERLFLFLNTRISYRLVEQVTSHLQDLPQGFFHRKNSVHLAKNIETDAGSIVSYSLSLFQNVILNISVVIMGLFLIWKLSPYLVAFIVVVLVLYSMAYLLMRKKVYETNRRLREDQSAYFTSIHEQISFYEFIRLHSVVSLFRKRMEKMICAVFQSASRHQLTSFSFSSVEMMISMIVNLGIFIVGGKAVIDGAITIGSYTIIVTYFSFIMGALKYFFGLGGQTQATLVSLDRLCDITDRKALQDGTLYDDAIKEIRLEKISFSYNAEPVLYNFTQVFFSGMIYAVTGKNGQGKSTLLKLLSGLYTEEMKGEIYINGKSITEYNMKKMREEIISFCEQEPVLLSGNLYESLFLHGTDRIDVNKYSELRQILNLEELLPPSVDALKGFYINEKSSNLSGGERQKLTLLRSLLPSAGLLLLDEPTASLDMSARHSLMEYLNKIKHHCIIIMVTHEEEIAGKADILINLSG